ncbi:MAG: FIST N-terminal domain-containing protein [Candidatus Nanopelagicales bacterium]
MDERAAAGAGDGRTRVADGLVIGDDVVASATEAARAARDGLGGGAPDLAFVFVSGAEPPDAAAALRAAAGELDAAAVVGCDAHGVIGGGVGVERVPAASVWAARLPGARVDTFTLDTRAAEDLVVVDGVPHRAEDDVVAVLLVDPWTFPADAFFAQRDNGFEGLPVIGGFASGSATRGGTRLLVDGRIRERGAVGVVLGGDVAVQTMVSQGCRPIGPPMTVTAVDGPVLLELAGSTALASARAVVESLPREEQALAVRGLHLGIAIDEYAPTHACGDFLVRGIVGVDQDRGGLSVGEVLPVGSTVQFHLRDADAADDDLTTILDSVRDRLGPSGLAGALLVSCNGRGRSMFPTADHDVAEVRRVLGGVPVAGFFAAGEIGPVGGRTHLHGFTASMLAFPSGERPPGHIEAARPSVAGMSQEQIDAELRELLDG